MKSASATAQEHPQTHVRGYDIAKTFWTPGALRDHYPHDIN